MSALRRDGRDRREALLDAALACFAARGVLGTGIEEIRRAAGASPSSVYHLFRGLPDLIAALLVRTFERLFAHLARRVSATCSAEHAIHALVDGHLEWILANRDEGRFMYQATAIELAPDVAERLMAEKAVAMAPLLATIRAHVEGGSLPPWPPAVLDVVLLGASHEACRRLLAGAPLDPTWLRATLPALAWRSVRGIEGAPT